MTRIKFKPQDNTKLMKSLEETVNEYIEAGHLTKKDLVNIGLIFGSHLIHHSTLGDKMDRNTFREKVVKEFNAILAARFMLNELDLEQKGPNGD